MNPGEIYTAPELRSQYMQLHLTPYWVERLINVYDLDPNLITDGYAIRYIEWLESQLIEKIEQLNKPTNNIPITYSIIESLRTGKAWPGGMPDSNSFHEGAKAMAIHLGYEVEDSID